MENIKLHIADSSFIVREGLESVFSALDDVELVGATANSDDLKKHLLSTSPTVLLINYSSEGFHASDAFLAMRLLPGLRVIGMTAACEVETIQKLLESGLSGHLMCDCDKDEIVDSVLMTSKGEKFFCGKVLDKINAEKDVAHGCEPVVISEREIEILQLVAQGLTTKQIAEKIHLSFHTVMTHRKNMMAKLGITNTAGLIIYAVRENLISPNKFLFSQNQ